MLNPQQNPAVANANPAPAPDPREPLLLLHGMWSRGEWQQHVAPVLEPFFKLVGTTYPQFRLFGAPGLFMDPWLLLAGGLMMGCAFMFQQAWTLAFGILTIGLSATEWPVRWRMNRAVAHCRRSCENHLAASPSVIAHSLGTVLATRLLGDPATYFNRLLLAGCVLPPDYNWQQLQAEGKVRAVRNEFSRQDHVACAAGWLSLLRTDLGAAGARGFARSSGFHLVDDPDDCCNQCADAPTGQFHDVDVSPVKHTDVHSRRHHAALLWLPFLWGFDPGEYRWLLRWARERDEALRLRVGATLETTRAAFEKRLHMLGGVGLAEVLSAELREGGLPDDAGHVGLALNQFAEGLLRGVRAEFKPERRDCIDNLHPLQLQRAVVGRMLQVRQSEASAAGP